MKKGILYPLNLIMNILIDLLWNGSDARVVNKDVKDVKKGIECMLMDDTSILAPSIILNDFDLVADWRDVNYVFIKNFGRYYYVTNMTFLTDGFCKLDLDVDVLMTYKDLIKGSTQLVTRSEKSRNRYIVDNQMPIHSDNAYTIKQSGVDIITPNVPSNAKTSSSLIMATVGRGTLTGGV